MSNLSKTVRYVNDLGTEIIFDYDHGYVINKPKGIDNLSVSYNEAVGRDRVGTQLIASAVAHRPVTISGYVSARPSAACKQLLLDAFLPEVGGKLYIDDYYLETVVTAAPTVSYHRVLPEFSLQLLAPYPYWISTNMVIAEFVNDYADIINDQAISCGYEIRCTIESGAANYLEFGVGDTNLLLKLRGKTSDFFVKDEIITITSDHKRLKCASTMHGDITGLITANSNLRRIPAGNVRLSMSKGGSTIPMVNASIRIWPEKAGVVL